MKRTERWMVAGGVVTALACGSRTGIDDETAFLLAGDATTTSVSRPEAGKPESGIEIPPDVSVPDAILAPDSGLLCEGGLPPAYLFGEYNGFYRFDPNSGAATFLGVPSCGGQPMSAGLGYAWTMSVSRTGVAYLAFANWHIYALDIATFACTETPFNPDVFGGLNSFGLAVSRTPGAELLYLFSPYGRFYDAGADEGDSIFATMTPPSFALMPITLKGTPGTAFDMQADLLGDLWILVAGGTLIDLHLAGGGTSSNTTFATGESTWAIMTYQDQVYLFRDATFSLWDPTTKTAGPPRDITGLTTVQGQVDYPVGASALPCYGIP